MIIVLGQKKYSDLELSKTIGGNVHIAQEDADGLYGEIWIDTTGAKQLMKVLQEFVENE